MCSVLHFTVFCFFLCVVPITFLLVTHHFFAKSVSGAREHVRFSYHDANSLGGGGGGRGGGQVGNKVAIRMVGELERRRRRREEGRPGGGEKKK